jgi:hypothetical protein
MMRATWTAVLVVTLFLATIGSAHALQRRGGLDFDSIRVPAVCDYPAARLVDGVHPDSDDRGGVIMRGAGVRASGTMGSGDDERAVKVATLGCFWSFHGVGDAVVIYDAAGAPLEAFELDDVVGGFVPTVRDVRIRSGKLVIDVVNMYAEDDSVLFASRSARVVVALTSTGFDVVKRTVYRERAAAAAFVRAIDAKRPARAKRFATDKVVDRAMAVRRGARGVRLYDCVGTESRAWPSWVDVRQSRMCVMVATYRGGGESGYGLFMGRTSWKTYEARAFRGIAG